MSPEGKKWVLHLLMQLHTESTDLWQSGRCKLVWQGEALGIVIMTLALEAGVALVPWLQLLHTFIFFLWVAQLPLSFFALPLASKGDSFFLMQ